MTARQLLAMEQILAILRETPGRLGQLTAGLDEAELHAAPEPGEWSATEILAHLRSCADVWGAAVETIVENDHPTIRAVNPRTWIRRTDYRELEFAPSLAAFGEQRDRLLALLARLPSESWSASATVVKGGSPRDLTVHSYLHRLARHERTHWRQVAKTAQAVARRTAADVSAAADAALPPGADVSR